ncbi:aminopeptidase [Bdellovibrionota bacterium FG-1]
MALFFLVSLSGCTTARYLTQATRGQLSLLNHATPIEKVLKNERISPRIRKLLAEVAPIKAFGEQKGLKPTSNYTEYVQLDRPAAVWVVGACEKLNFKSKEWAFPIVGRFPYLGWFDLEDAKRFATELKAEDWDVDLRGAGAYSTLGWFRDAILSSMIPDGAQALGDLVNVVLHESVHATVYLNGQAYFNESVASFVADRLTAEFLGQRLVQEREPYLKGLEEGHRREKRLHEIYESLATLYASSKSVSDKTEEKGRILAAAKEELGFRRDINNATLIQFKTYSTGGVEFEALWKACGDDSQRFMKAIATLTDKSFQKPQQENLESVLTPLVQSGCRAI